jgi:2-methylisocitrate lyase-like PEP mutase family enzyme
MDFSVRRKEFRRLHESGCFVIPNPWDVGSARYLQGLGFKALATTSSGFAFSRGLPDAEWAVSRDLMLEYIAELVAATDLPVNADFQAGYGDKPEDVAKSVRLCVETGVAGLSIEDRSGERGKPLYEFPQALERLKAAREAISASGAEVLLTARAECFLVDHPDPLGEAVRRLQAYAEAGADVLFAPGLRHRWEIETVVAAVSPKPVNVLIGADIGLRVADLTTMGVRRISVGSSLARSAWTGFIHAAKLIAEEGSFAGFEGLVSGKELNEFFQKHVAETKQE